MAVGEAVDVGVGVGVACTTTLQTENSEVLLFGSVAVAVTNWPAGMAFTSAGPKLAWPPLPVVLLNVPRKF